MNEKPPFPSVRACIALAAVAVAVGLALRFVVPPEAPDAAFLARVEAWKRLAIEMQSPDHPAHRDGRRQRKSPGAEPGEK